jgi:hypothetical protein
MGALDAHNAMSTQALNSPDVQRRLKDILLNHSVLYERGGRRDNTDLKSTSREPQRHRGRGFIRLLICLCSVSPVPPWFVGR